MDNPLANIDVSNNDDNDIEYVSISKQNNGDNIPVEFRNDSVSAVNLCQSDDARKLCIFNLDHKLQHSDHYDIGGTYTKLRPDLWFYCYTTISPDANNILNLFACHRNTGSFSISISETKDFTKIKSKDPFTYHLEMPNKLIAKTYNSAKIDQHHYLISYCFKQEDLSILENKTLCIPLRITINPKCPIDKNIIMGIKRRHGLTKLFKRHENTDFVLQSSGGQKYDTHRIILATHSSVLREVVRDMKTNSASIDVSDDEMELMLEFMYTGTIKSLLDKNMSQLLDIAHQFKLENLNLLTQHAITHKINVSNAVEIALLTQKYQLDSLQKTVFEFIKKNPLVLESDGWQNLNDVALTKKLFKKICVGNDHS